MLKTGKDFDMNPDTFTLENLFSMELHNFAETIAEIVTAASKELSIERGLKEVYAVTDVPSSLNFSNIDESETCFSKTCCFKRFSPVP